MARRISLHSELIVPLTLGLCVACSDLQTSPDNLGGGRPVLKNQMPPGVGHVPQGPRSSHLVDLAEIEGPKPSVCPHYRPKVVTLLLKDP